MQVDKTLLHITLNSFSQFPIILCLAEKIAIMQEFEFVIERRNDCLDSFRLGNNTGMEKLASAEDYCQMVHS